MRRFRLSRLLTLVLIALLGGGVAPSHALAQVQTVRLGVEREFLGFGGVARPGSWAPVRLSLLNEGADNRAVICRWLINDYDGDEVLAERAATLNPQRTQYVWLYAVPPVNAQGNATWTFQVVDQQTGEALATQQHAPPELASMRAGIIGVFSTADLGLDAYTPKSPYTRPFAAHEPLGLVRGLSLTTLPDRWYGLQSMQSLVWTSEGGSPDDAAVTPAMQAALREWVRRGGHLVIVLPAIGEPWTTSSLKDLLPVTPAQIRRVEGPPPKFVYDVAPTETLTIGLTVFDNVEESGGAVLQRDDNGDALVVAKRYGFGRVTLIGVDLADRRLARLGMGAGGYRVWNTVFGWNGPVITFARADAKIKAAEMTSPENFRDVELGAFVPHLIAMTGAVAPSLLLAILVFLLYLAVAGPISFAVLRTRKQAHRSWLVFVVVVAGFTAVTWGGAWLMRPRATSVAHFSVLDIDAKTGDVRTQSWLSLFVPSFGRSTIAIAGDPQNPGDIDTIWAPGLAPRVDDTGFLDPQRYAIDVSSPDEVSVPVRATAKQFTLNYVGKLNEQVEGVTHPWVAPQGTLTIDPLTSYPTGDLRHALPGPLKNVLFVYAPGSTANNPTPWVWRVPEWAPEQTLKVASPNQMGQMPARLVQRPRSYDDARNFKAEGHLGALMDSSGAPMLGPVDPFSVTIDDFQRVSVIEMLSFYDLLPPPDYARPMDFANLGVVYQRSIGRGLDLTPLTAGARMIIIGHLEKSPLPAPLTVDGDAVEAEGPTVVRWIYDL